MKHNWEYKRLGEICTLSAGGDKPSETQKTKTPDCAIPVFSNGIENEGLYGFCNKPKIDVPAITISARGTIGIPFMRTNPFVPIIRLIVVIPPKELNIKYLYYWILYRKFAGNGVAVPQLTVPMITDELMPIPPMEVQEQIVAELDKINEVIADCRELLHTLDSLAQSLFYDYFGDPNSSTKYEKISFGKLSINYDSKRKPVTKKDRLAGIYPYYGASGIVDYVCLLYTA
ncbi:MAG: restriction endonuclease subunit S, partial [Muribaculaceae bacterium]|nr:restriction endonuclease subunit S [Muribaculaceae bacterium]